MNRNEKYKHFSGEKIGIGLQSVKVGDLIKINNWNQPMRVKCISNNYFVMTVNRFGNVLYSVVSKKPWNGIRYNNMVGGMYHCGTDNWVFGSPLQIDCENLYEFNNDEFSKQYLDDFEKEKCELSYRTSIAIFDLYIKPAEEKPLLLAYLRNPPTKNNSKNIMGCCESWYDPYYAIKESFSIEEIERMSEREIKNLIKLAWNISEGLY